MPVSKDSILRKDCEGMLLSGDIVTSKTDVPVVALALVSQCFKRFIVPVVTTAEESQEEGQKEWYASSS